MRLIKSATAVSANYLQRVADPTCRFYADYLEYKNRRISLAQLVERLPHIAMIGDSLSKDVYISSTLSTFWRARTRHGNNWFLNVDPSPASVCNGRASAFGKIMRDRCDGSSRARESNNVE